MNSKLLEPQSKLFKALMHPARLAILQILRNGDECVCHMEALLGYRQAYISQHLSVLREAGLVQDRREGWNIYYHVIQPDIFAILDLADRVTDSKQGNNFFPILIPGCTCPKCSIPVG
jgi:DNA-binding transcriptional ArsR family regulator